MYAMLAALILAGAAAKEYDSIRVRLDDTCYLLVPSAFEIRPAFPLESIAFRSDDGGGIRIHASSGVPKDEAAQNRMLIKRSIRDGFEVDQFLITSGTTKFEVVTLRREPAVIVLTGSATSLIDSIIDCDHSGRD